MPATGAVRRAEYSLFVIAAPFPVVRPARSNLPRPERAARVLTGIVARHTILTLERLCPVSPAIVDWDTRGSSSAESMRTT